MASANVNFEKIQTSTRKPGVYVEWNTKLAVRNLPTNKQRVLLIGQHSKPELGDLTALENVYSAADVAAKYGAGSQVHLMALAAMKAYAYADLSLIAVADNSAGVAATGTITVTGIADTQGVVRVTIGNADTLTVGVAAEATAAKVAEAIKTAVNAETALPVTAESAEGVVTLTAKNKGAHGNHIRIRTSNTADGISVAVKAMSSGDVDADIGPALTAAIAEGHHLIAVGCTDEANLLKLRNHLETVGAPEEKRWALGIYGQTGTLSQATTLAGRLNSGYMYAPWYRKTPSLPCELAAAFAAVVASEEDPARPLNTLKLNGIGVCDSADKTMRTEQENALYNGVAPIETSPDGTSAQIMRAISTYTQSGNGTEDESLLDITTVRTLIYVSGACTDRIALRFPRDKMTERTIGRVRSELIDVLMRCEELEIVEKVEDNLDNLIVERDAQNTGMLNCRIPSDVVNGLHQVGMVIDLYL